MNRILTAFFLLPLLASPLMAASPAPVVLGAADSFSILAGSGITNIGASSATGYVGTYPTPSETGFNTLNMQCTDHGADSFTQSAQGSLTTAYNDAAGRVVTAVIATELGGTSLFPGVYTSGAGDFFITGTLTLNGNGDPNAVFIFQTASTLKTAPNAAVVLVNGAQAKNVFWAVGSSATLDSGTQFKGTILAYTSITVVTGSSIEGRLLALNGAVTIDSGSIDTSTSATAPCAPVSATPTPNGTFTATPTPNGTFTATPTPNGTFTATRTPLRTFTNTPTAQGTFTATRTPVSTQTYSPTAAVSPVGIMESYIYPSPAKGDFADVTYDMHEAGSVTLRFHNQAGRLVDTVREAKPRGWQKSRVSVGKFAPGTYYYVLSMVYASGAVETRAARKFVVAR